VVIVIRLSVIWIDAVGFLGITVKSVVPKNETTAQRRSPTDHEVCEPRVIDTPVNLLGAIASELNFSGGIKIAIRRIRVVTACAPRFTGSQRTRRVGLMITVIKRATFTNQRKRLCRLVQNAQTTAARSCFA